MHLIRRIGAAALMATAVAFTVGTGNSAQAATATVRAVPSGTSAPVTFDGPVRAVSFSGPTVLVAGDFTHATVNGTTHSRTRLAAFDGRTGHLYPWAPTADGPVLALAADVHTRTIFIAGNFNKINGSTRDGLARLDFNGDLLPFNHHITGTPRALATSADRLYVAGSISAVDGRPVPDLAAFSLATGGYDADFAAAPDGPVHALLVDGSRLYLGGDFTRLNGDPGVARLAAVNTVTGVRDTGFTAQLNRRVLALAKGPGSIYAGLGGTGGRTVALTRTGALRWQLYTDGDVRAVTYLDGVVYYGGHFDNVCGDADQDSQGGCMSAKAGRVKLAAAIADSGALLPWNPQANGVVGVHAMAAHRFMGRLIAAGEFTTIGGRDLPRLVEFA
jgi:hypothetical protein